MRSILGATLVLTIAASLVACEQPDTVDALDGVDEPTLETRDKPGSGGTNGLPGGLYFDYERDVIDAAKRRLIIPGTTEIVPEIGYNMLQVVDGRRVFEYAVACAVPDGVVVTWKTYSFPGKGHLTTTERWLKEPLDEQGFLDLLACVVAHINPQVGVDILLSGPDVTDDGQNHSLFWVDEARWIARVGEYGIDYIVWPNPLFVPPPCVVSGDPMDALKERVCGKDPGRCALRQGYEADCKLEGGQTWCLGQPAIMTSLQEQDVPTMYCF